MTRHFGPVTVDDYHGYNRVVAHGTGDDLPTTNIACGPFGNANLPTLRTRYTLTATTPNGPDLQINMYCTFSGDTSDFRLNPPDEDQQIELP